MTPIAVAVHAATAGWRGADLVTAVAVAMGASGGSETRPGGLWGVGTAGDPAASATGAHALWKASGWDAFPAHRNRRYLMYMPVAAVAVAAPEVVAITAREVVRDAVQSLPGVDAAQNAVALGVKASAWMSDRHNWVRVAQVVAGMAMLGIGLTMIARPDRAVTAIVGGAAKSVVGKAIGGK